MQMLSESRVTSSPNSSCQTHFATGLLPAEARHCASTAAPSELSALSQSLYKILVGYRGRESKDSALTSRRARRRRRCPRGRSWTPSPPLPPAVPDPASTAPSGPPRILEHVQESDGAEFLTPLAGPRAERAGREGRSK